MVLLSHAYLCAKDAAADVWDFALEIDTLFAAGLTISSLRWLVAKRFANHAQESSVFVLRIAPSAHGVATSSRPPPVWSSHPAVPNSLTIS